MEPVHIPLELSRSLYNDLVAIGVASRVGLAGVFAQALALTLIAHRCVKAGQHLGLVEDPAKLDTEITGLL